MILTTNILSILIFEDIIILATFSKFLALSFSNYLNLKLILDMFQNNNNNKLNFIQRYMDSMAISKFQ